MAANDVELPALRISDLKRIGQSPAHYRAAAQVAGSHLDKGSAVHSVLLGGKRVTYFDRVTDSGKAAPRNGQHWEKFQADNAGALILTREEHAQTMGMADAVRANADAVALLQGAREQSLYWDILGRRCRGTPDVRAEGFITELKTCRSSDPKRFMWDAIKLGYFAQLAWYLDGTLKAKAGAPAEAFIVAVESTAPYVVTVYQLTARALEMGRASYRKWFETLAACEDADVWPGYTQCIVPLDAPEHEGEIAGAEEEAA